MVNNYIMLDSNNKIGGLSEILHNLEKGLCWSRNYLFNGKTYIYVKGSNPKGEPVSLFKAQDIPNQKKATLLKTIAAIILLIPTTLLGNLFHGLALAMSIELKKCYTDLSSFVNSKDELLKVKHAIAIHFEKKNPEGLVEVLKDLNKSGKLDEFLNSDFASYITSKDEWTKTKLDFAISFNTEDSEALFHILSNLEASGKLMEFLESDFLSYLDLKKYSVFNSFFLDDYMELNKLSEEKHFFEAKSLLLESDLKENVLQKLKVLKGDLKVFEKDYIEIYNSHLETIKEKYLLNPSFTKFYEIFWRNLLLHFINPKFKDNKTDLFKSLIEFQEILTTGVELDKKVKVLDLSKKTANSTLEKENIEKEIEDCNKQLDDILNNIRGTFIAKIKHDSYGTNPLYENLPFWGQLKKIINDLSFIKNKKWHKLKDEVITVMQEAKKEIIEVVKEIVIQNTEVRTGKVRGPDENMDWKQFYTDYYVLKNAK